MGFWNLLGFGFGKAVGDAIKETKQENQRLNQLYLTNKEKIINEFFKMHDYLYQIDNKCDNFPLAYNDIIIKELKTFPFAIIIDRAFKLSSYHKKLLDELSNSVNNHTLSTDELLSKNNLMSINNNWNMDFMIGDAWYNIIEVCIEFPECKKQLYKIIDSIKNCVKFLHELSDNPNDYTDYDYLLDEYRNNIEREFDNY